MLSDEDVDAARTLIGLALSRETGDSEGRDTLADSLAGLESERVARVAASLLLTMASSLAEASEDFSTPEEVLRWFAESFGQGQR
ncbi:MAG: hypothetical protein ABI635_10150 [Actinomycetota bacterium]